MHVIKRQRTNDGKIYKTITLGFTHLFLFPTLCFSQEYNFRKTEWGYTKKQVMDAEKGTPIKEDDDFICYTGKLAGSDVFIMYFFLNNKLCRAKYAYYEKHTNKNSFLSKYDKYKSLLIKKYGKPQKKKILFGVMICIRMIFHPGG